MEHIISMHNDMNGKLILGRDGSRLYLGGGMGRKILVAVIEGGGK